MNKKIKLVIFDLDGTLVNAYPAIVQSFNFMRHQLGLPSVDSTTISRAVGWGDKNLLKPFIKTKDLTKALSIYRRHHAHSLIKKTKFLSGAHQLLRRLEKQGYKISLASNRPTRFSHIILRSLKMDKYFDYVLCGDKLKKPKPHPDILHRILKKLSLTPTEAVYVGDMTVDIEAGKKAKVKTIAVATGSNTKKELKELDPYRVVSRVAEVYNIVEGMNNRHRIK